jgi:hypothetical protein
LSESLTDREQCDWGVTELTMESTARALLHHCLATSPASEALMVSIMEVKTPDTVVDKFCPPTTSLARFETAIFGLLEAAWHPARTVKHNYDYLLTLTQQIKRKNYEAAQKGIGSYIADIYNRVMVTFKDCPTETQKRVMLAGAETLYSQVRGVVGNKAFAQLFGLRNMGRPNIQMAKTTSSSGISTLSMSRVGLSIRQDRPVAVYVSSSENKAIATELGRTNHADLDTKILYQQVMKDVQPYTRIFIITSSPLPALSDNFISSIGSAQSSGVTVNVILVDAAHGDQKGGAGMPRRSQDLYNILTTFSQGKLYQATRGEVPLFIPLIEYALIESQSLITSRVVNEPHVEFSIPADRSMKAVTVEATCKSGGVPKIRVFEPQTRRNHFEYVEMVKVGSLGFWLIEDVIPGKWTFELSCDGSDVGPIAYDVRAESSINFQLDHTAFTEDAHDLVIKSLSLPKLRIKSAGTLSATEAHQYHQVVSQRGQVAKLKKSGGENNRPEIDYGWMPTDYDEGDADFMEDKALHNPIPQKSSLGFGQPSLSHITAIDENNDVVHREFPNLDENRLQVKSKVAELDFQPGSTVHVTIRVHNNGEQLHLTATDYEGWVEKVTPTSTSAQDQVTIVSVTLTAPLDARIGAETTVTVTAINNVLEGIDSTKFVISVGQTETPEVKKMLVDSNIENRFGRTIVQSRVYNQHRAPRDAVFSVFLPDAAFITSYRLFIRNHTFEGEIIEPKHLGRPTDWVSPSTVVMEDEHEWRVKVRMDSWDNALFELIYDQPLMKQNGKYPYKVDLQGRQKIDDVDIQVALYDEDGIKEVQMIHDDEEDLDDDFAGAGLVPRDGLQSLGRDHRLSFADELTSAAIQIDDTRKSATISFSPSKAKQDIIDMSRSLGAHC